MKYTKLILAVLAVIIAGVIAAGCIAPQNSQTPQGEWILTGIGSDNTPVIGIISLEITDTGISGNSGVNAYFGSVTFGPENNLTITGLGSTKMAGPANLMQQEQKYYNTLKAVTGWKIIDGTLTLTDNTGSALLTFADAAKSPAGTWTLDSDPSVTLSILPDGTINGRAPVNSYFGTYTLSVSNGLAFAGIGSTLMAGDDPRMQNESVFFTALNNVSGCKLENSTLRLTDSAGAVLLTFTKTPAIVGKWLLASDQNVTLHFNADGSLGGLAPVNVYGGSYTAADSTLSVGDDIISTMMAGTDEEMQAEFAFFAALKASAGYKIIDGSLIITDKDGTELLVLLQG